MYIIYYSFKFYIDTIIYINNFKDQNLSSFLVKQNFIIIYNEELGYFMILANNKTIWLPHSYIHTYVYQLVYYKKNKNKIKYYQST